MPVCDICNTPLSNSSMIVIGPEKIKNATSMGYVPSKMGGSELLSLFGHTSASDKTNQWQYTVQRSGFADWGLCRSCMSEVDRFLSNSTYNSSPIADTTYNDVLNTSATADDYDDFLQLVITDSCIECSACADVCPTEAIQSGTNKYVIDTDICVSCEACVFECPVEAIIPSDTAEKTTPKSSGNSSKSSYSKGSMSSSSVPCKRCDSSVPREWAETVSGGLCGNCFNATTETPSQNNDDDAIEEFSVKSSPDSHNEELMSLEKLEFEDKNPLTSVQSGKENSYNAIFSKEALLSGYHLEGSVGISDYDLVTTTKAKARFKEICSEEPERYTSVREAMSSFTPTFYAPLQSNPYMKFDVVRFSVGSNDSTNGIFISGYDVVTVSTLIIKESESVFLALPFVGEDKKDSIMDFFRKYTASSGQPAQQHKKEEKPKANSSTSLRCRKCGSSVPKDWGTNVSGGLCGNCFNKAEGSSSKSSSTPISNEAMSSTSLRCRKCGASVPKEWGTTVSNGLCGNCYKPQKKSATTPSASFRNGFDVFDTFKFMVEKHRKYSTNGLILGVLIGPFVAFGLLGVIPEAFKIIAFFICWLGFSGTVMGLSPFFLFKYKDRINFLKSEKVLEEIYHSEECLNTLFNSSNHLTVIDELWGYNRREEIKMQFEHLKTCNDNNCKEMIETSDEVHVVPSEESIDDTKQYFEKDNMGTRQQTLHDAETYWASRNINQSFDPFILSVFDNSDNARSALLALPCIAVAQDTGNLICTETLIFGYYVRDDGKTEALICGNDLTIDTWEAAKKSFKKSGGTVKTESKPEKSAQSLPQSKSKDGDPKKVKFVREEKDVIMGETCIYRIHKGPNVASAQAFLANKPVTKSLYYIVVETPDGNYCRDKDGIYKEQ